MTDTFIPPAVSKDQVESLVKSILSPSHAVIYVLTALLAKLIEREVLSLNEVNEILDSLEMTIRDADDPNQIESKVTLSVIGRFRNMLGLTDPS